MSEPVCVQKAPYGVELAVGDYFWCACGLSKQQPFCDGAHKTTVFKPTKFSITQPEKKWLCGCKQSKSPPFCDGTHKSL